MTAAVLGAIVGFAVISITPGTTPETTSWAIFSGALAISAMVLPGISGSFVLLLAGQYERAIAAASNRDFGTLALFAAGAVLGVFTFVRVLRWTLKRWNNITLASLVGLMVGTAPRLWPWGDAPSSFTMGTSSQVLTAGLLFVAGIGILIFFEKLVGVRSDTV